MLVGRLCLTVSPVSPVCSTHGHCTRQANGMTFDNYVMEKLSRHWRGRVQPLADVERENEISCHYPCSQKRESNFFLTN